MRIVFLSILWWSIGSPIAAQFNRDSVYSYKDLDKILQLARSNNDHKTLAEVYIKMGDYEGDVLSEYDKSLIFYKNAMDYFKLLKDSNRVVETNQMIAKRYIDAGIYDEAVNILTNIESIYLRNQKKEGLAHIYFDLNRAYKAMGDIEKSIEYLAKAKAMNDIVRDPVFMMAILLDQIQSFELSYELDSALQKAFVVFKLSSEREDREMVAKSLFHIGYINKLKKDYSKAKKYLNKSEAIVPFQAYSELRKMVYKEIADVHFKSGDIKVAYGYLLKYAMLNDSILHKNRLESFNNVALKYGAQEKQTSIELLKIEKKYAEEKNKSQRRTLYILAIGLFVVTLSIYFIIKFYDQRISTAKIITEQKEEINKQQIRKLEDDIKMSSMRSVIEGQEIERERIAKDLHDSLGGLLSTIKLHFDQVQSKRTDLNELKEYKKAYELLDTAVEEVRSISRNLQPGSLQDLGLVPAIKDLINRFDGGVSPVIDFQFYDLPDKIDKMVSLSIYRVVQELLTNSLKHAQASEILIQINTEGDELVIQYEDDGIGFDQNNLKRKGMGLENIKSRVNYMHGTITIDTAKDMGISVLIRVRYV